MTIPTRTCRPSPRLALGSTRCARGEEGESCGKDEDWIASQQLLKVSEAQRRELLEAHEADVEFLKRHHVMDYSVLVPVPKSCYRARA